MNVWCAKCLSELKKECDVQKNHRRRRNRRRCCCCWSSCAKYFKLFIIFSFFLFCSFYWFMKAKSTVKEAPTKNPQPSWIDCYRNKREKLNKKRRTKQRREGRKNRTEKNDDITNKHIAALLLFLFWKKIDWNLEIWLNDFVAKLYIC